MGELYQDTYTVQTPPEDGAQTNQNRWGTIVGIPVPIFWEQHVPSHQEIKLDLTESAECGFLTMMAANRTTSGARMIKQAKLSTSQQQAENSFFFLYRQPPKLGSVPCVFVV